MSRGIALPFHDLGVYMGGGWSAPRPARFTPGKDPVPIVQEAGWAPGPVWTGAENLASTPGFDPRTFQPHSESLYRLSYRGPRLFCMAVPHAQIVIGKRKFRASQEQSKFYKTRNLCWRREGRSVKRSENTARRDQCWGGGNDVI